MARMRRPAGERIIVDTGRERIAGTFVDLDEGGALLLRDGQGAERRLTFGDVALARPAGGGARVMAEGP